jgi:hypothetical protein
MPTFRVHRLLASSCYQFISILVLPGKFQETGCGGPKYLMRNSTFPAICVVEISGAVRQALSDFDVLHASSTIFINPRAFPDKDACFCLQKQSGHRPRCKFWWWRKYFTVFKSLVFLHFSLSRLLIDSLRLNIRQLLFIISLWVIQKHLLDSRSMGLSLGLSSTKTSSNQNLLVIMTSTSRLRHVGFAPLMFIPSVVDGARSTSLSALVMVIVLLCTFRFYLLN